ncbi:MAG TPA: HlyD family secretion protein [Halieaceae bacterium]|jgi:membrane fusion protein (multidrug efflux system)|uniref:HlyD family secretion protein n=1 Tax=Haliea TaxID=475794 RepID=UPI000C474657|nr:HlyD family secretion protein [Haliea sp.]HAN68861.1 HlyD family secretion protein [Halieaceae bacterium]MAD63971.1 multidrug transporter [Haliea sp.]MAY92376.1 multidrug transporter [Haliea sp.]MBK40996.1 multidrug transporter [Haliea sp.]MBP68429.1 multidrug transporter [Haliea sp.]
MSQLLHRRLLMGAGLLAGALAVAWFALGGRGSISTENAYVKANKLALSSEVNAIVKAVLVQPNQPVTAGQLLVQLEDEPFQLAVAEAEAHLAQVQNQIMVRRADYAEVEAEIRQAEEDAAFYQRQLTRNQRMGPSAISEADLDDSRQQLARSQAQIAINRQKLAGLRAALGGSPDVPLEAQADIQVAQAQLDRALYQLSRTRITAPASGTVANDVPQLGEMTMAGFAVVTLMATDNIWIEANLKETQLTDVRPGQMAEVTIDAYPGQVLRARVDTLSPASGSEFAMIPAQNASGNWVKVVQRIPVRLRLESKPEDAVLRAGMSAQVRIATEPSESLASAQAQPAPGGNQVAASPL